MTKKTIVTAVLTAALAAAVSVGVMAEESEKIEAGGLVFMIPEEYKDLLTIETEGLEPGTLISVSETASIEAAEEMGEETDGAGWLFSISAVSEDELHKLRCGDMSGMDVFAEDDDTYYIYNHPTDVRLIRENNEEMNEAMNGQWSELNDWAYQDVRMSTISNNPGLELETYSNTELDMYLAQAAFEGKDFEIRSLEAGTFDPTAAGETDELEDLTEDVFYEMVTDPDEEEIPDGEYIVMAFDEDGVRFDFLLGEGMENYIREVKTLEDGETYETIYKANFKDTDKTAAGIMKEWIQELTNTDDDGEADSDD